MDHYAILAKDAGMHVVEDKGHARFAVVAFAVRKIGGTTVEAVMVTKDAMATIAAFVMEGGKDLSKVDIQMFI